MSDYLLLAAGESPERQAVVAKLAQRLHNTKSIHLHTLGVEEQNHGSCSYCLLDAGNALTLLAQDHILVPITDLPDVAEDDEGFMSVSGLNHMDFVGGPISMKKSGRSAPVNINQNPRNEYVRAVAHLAFMRHLEADPDEATRVCALAKSFADADDHAWWELKDKKRAKYLKRARLADRSARERVTQ